MNYLIIEWEPHCKLVATECNDKRYHIQILRNDIELNLTHITTNAIVSVLNAAQEYLNKYGRKVEYE